MILEIAYVEVAILNQSEFELAARKAVDEIMSSSSGFIDFEMCRGIEDESTYVFIVRWETLEDHIFGFRESELFQKWRAAISPYFEKPPVFSGHWEIKTS